MNSKTVSQLFDLSPHTLRYYERVGAIPPVTRDEKGYRTYKTRDLNWVYLVKSLRGAGLSIESLIEFATLSQMTGNKRAAQKQILREQLTEIEEKLLEMEQVRDLLAYKLETYDEHLAKFESGELNDENVEKLWQVKFN